MLANVDLKDALVGCLDKDKALRTMSNISKKLVDDRLTLVLAHATAVLDMHPTLFGFSLQVYKLCKRCVNHVNHV